MLLCLGLGWKGEKPPQWVLIRFDMSTTTPKVKMTTDLSEISEFVGRVTFVRGCWRYRQEDIQSGEISSSNL